jgi:hypothetical protein
MRRPGRVLGGVVEQISDDLGQPRHVAVDDDLGPVPWRQHEIVAPGVDHRPTGLDRVGDHRRELDPFLAQLDLALRDAADVEQVVDEMDELAQLALDHAARALVGAAFG